jgi:hypothetical protein
VERKVSKKVYNKLITIIKLYITDT